jgi:hypothetical protein
MNPAIILRNSGSGEPDKDGTINTPRPTQTPYPKKK